MQRKKWFPYFVCTKLKFGLSEKHTKFEKIFQECCHFQYNISWLCFDFSNNDNTFERSEDCATDFLKWMDFSISNPKKYIFKVNCSKITLVSVSWSTNFKGSTDRSKGWIAEDNTSVYVVSLWLCHRLQIWTSQILVDFSWISHCKIYSPELISK